MLGGEVFVEATGCPSDRMRTPRPQKEQQRCVKGGGRGEMGNGAVKEFCDGEEKFDGTYLWQKE